MEFAGAVWHVTSRGNEQRPIFRDDHDRQAFLDDLARVIDRLRWRLHAFVLMTNHYHLLMETPETTMSRGMRELNGVYSQRFNRRHRRVGHLMQGRFKAILVEKEAHLLELTRYVVLNPVRAGMVARPERYRWSSYRATAGLTPPPPWLETRWTIGQFAPDSSLGVRLYRQFVEAGLESSARPLDGVRGQIYLGGEQFLQAVLNRIGPSHASEEVPKSQRMLERPTLERIARSTERVLGLPNSSLCRWRGRDARAMFASAIGEVLRVRASWAGRLAKRGEAQVAQDSSVRKKVSRIVALAEDDENRT
jgi:REP element-mobilizing transposase RayT